MSHTPPTPAERPVTTTHLDHTWTDRWAWLRDRDDPAVIAHLQAENAYAEAMTAHLDGLRQALYDEVLGRIQEDDTSVPWPRGPWRYYRRTEQGRPYAVHCRKLGDGGDEQVLLDENTRAGDKPYYYVGVLTVSPDHRWLAFFEDDDGSERYTVRFEDLSDGTLLDHTITGAKADGAWDRSGRYLFYTVPDDTDRPYRVYRHDREDPHAADALVFEEADPAWYVGVHRSRDDRFVLIGTGSKLSDEVWFVPAGDPTAAPTVIRPRTPKLEYQVEVHGEHFYLLHNRDARNFAVGRVPIADPAGPLEPVIAHDPAVYLTGIDAFAEHLVVWERRDGMSGMRVVTLATGAERVETFDDEVRVVGPHVNLEHDTGRVRITYESLLTPPSVFEVDLATGARTLLKRHPVPGYDPAPYVVERLWATSHDGTRVPISLAHRRDVTPHGDNPAFLYGYGAYGSESEPVFRNAWVSLLDRGVVCAIAHVRGGGELGRHWYESGRFEHKPNSFHDFVACGERLVALGWAHPDRLGAAGGSAGGLLMGASMNLRPDLFSAVLALVPFVDVTNTMLDETLPLTITEYDEWGDPRTARFFAVIRGYAPYDNAAVGPYPAVLATAGLNDPRVGFWEPAKWVARLRECTTSGRPVLLRTQLGAGHGGVSGRYGRIRESAFEYAFLLDRIGAASPV